MALIAVSACQPEPGETRCSSIPVGTIVATRCRTEPEREPPPAGWWCSTRADGFGVCARAPATCEAWRAPYTEFAPCEHRPIAVCANTGAASIGCYASAAACVQVERDHSRDGTFCVGAR